MGTQAEIEHLVNDLWAKVRDEQATFQLYCRLLRSGPEAEVRKVDTRRVETTMATNRAYDGLIAALLNLKEVPFAVANH